MDWQIDKDMGNTKPKPLNERILECHSQIDYHLEQLIDSGNFIIHEYKLEIGVKLLRVEITTPYHENLAIIQKDLEEIGDKHFAELLRQQKQPTYDTLSFQAIFILEF